MAVRLFKRTTQSCRCEIGAQNLIVHTLKPMREMSRWERRARKYSYSTLELLQLDVDPRRTWPVSVWTVTATSLVIVLSGTFVLPIILTTRVVSTTLIALIVALLWRSRRVTTRLEEMERTRRQIVRSMAPVAGHL